MVKLMNETDIAGIFIILERTLIEMPEKEMRQNFHEISDKIVSISHIVSNQMIRQYAILIALERGEKNNLL